MQSDQIFNESTKISTDYDSDVCRDFLRNTCKRGKKCKYKHPILNQGVDLAREPIFCRDYQNGICRRTPCKFLHYTKKKEVFFRIHGLVPPSQTSATETFDALPVCKDYLNHHCHRGSSCKFRHGKPTSNASDKLAFYHGKEVQSYDHHPRPQHLQYPDNDGGARGSIVSSPPPRTSESATVTTPETTAMVAAAAAAGYLALQQKHGQQQHHHPACGPGTQVSSAVPTSALPTASAAAVAAAAAATAIATQQQHAPLNQRYPDSTLNPPTSMQSLFGAVTNSDVLHPQCMGASSYSPPTSLSSATAPPCHFGTRGLRNSHFCVNPDEQVPSSVDFNMPSLANLSTKSATYGNPDGVNKPVNSHTSFSQHSQQQQEANAAAALAAAACFGAMLSQPVAAAAAASHAAVSKPTAGDMLSQTVGGDRTLSSMSASQSTVPAQSSASGGVTSPPPPPPPPPPSAVAAAAAAAVAAAVVSSAGPSAAVAAISAAHLATSSLSRAHPATHVSCAPTGNNSPLCASTSHYLATMNQSSVVDAMGVRRMRATNESMSIRMSCPSSSSPPSSQMGPGRPASSSLGSSAATAAYTATMTTAVAAAAMAAAAAVEEHNQKKNAAAAAMAAFNESAALAHESMSRITDLSSESLPSSTLIATTKSSLSEASSVYMDPEMPISPSNAVSHRRHRILSSHSRRQPRFPRFDVVDDESCEESYYEDEEDEAMEITPSQQDTPVHASKINRSCTPGGNFGRNPPIVSKPRKRSYSFPSCINQSIEEKGPNDPTSEPDVPLRPLSPQPSTSKASNTHYRERGFPFKRPKLDNVERVITSTAPDYPRRRYRRCPSRLQQQLDVESEMDEEEEFCYTGEAAFYSSTAVTPPSFRERIHTLKRENAQLRLRLQRLIRQRNLLQIENHTLMKQNMRLRKLGPSSKHTSAQSTNERLFQSLRAGSQSSLPVTVPNRKKSTVDCGTIGLQTLNKVIDQVEDCISRINRTVQQLNAKDQSAEVFINELQKFLETSILLREQFKRAFIQETPISASDLQCIDSFSDADNESFFSTVEEIDFSELELLILSNFHRPFYRNALKEINEASPPCRTIRTGFMLCSSDVEYLGKIICVRHGFDYILSKAEPVSWFIQAGKAVSCGLLINLGCATLDFENAFSSLLDYLSSLHDPDNMTQFADELASKGVQALNFYDIFFDRILIDALENLSDPPQSIYTLTRNTWLSPSFKRSALDSAVWTLMAAKRKMLKYPDGFFALYYRVVETVTASLAWGFLGTDESLNAFCESVREEIVSFLRSLFKFSDSVTSTNQDIGDDDDNDNTATTAFLDFEENEVDTEEDDVTITPEGEKPPALEEHPIYRGMDYSDIEAFSADVYANIATLQSRLATLIVDFAGNNSVQLPTNVREGLSLTQPPLQQASVSDV
ncbi:hypothetical protein Aperf_G00000034537 [Anoplocephala perfoliata]